MATIPRKRGQLPRTRNSRALVAVGIAIVVVIVVLVVVVLGSDWGAPRTGRVETPTPGSTPQPDSVTPTTLPSRRPVTPSPSLPSPSPPPRLIREDCRPGAGDAVARANELLANRYSFTFFPTVELPADPDWTENPLKSRNWEFQYHSLRFVWDLFSAFDTTRDQRYLDRAAVLLRDWVEDNPRRAGRSVFSWNDHATAWRAVVLVCAAELLRDEPWLANALVLHGRTLAAPAFYVGHGNHALNQNIGLLEVACRVDRRDWVDLAVRRLDRLVRESVDDQGVTNEQAVFYQFYNWNNYQRAVRRMRACGVPEPPSIARIDLMPEFLTHATLPNGEYVMLGDSGQRPAAIIRGTTAEFAATRGASGPPPKDRFAIFTAGFAFGRSGWGKDRPVRDEVAWSARFGPGQRWHGHADGLSLTLYGQGSRLIDDTGIFTYNHDRWRTYAIGRSAHNVVTVDGLPYDASRPTQLLAQSTSPSCDHLLLRNRGVAGVDHRRRIVFSPHLGYVLVDDSLTADARRTFRQLWHLVPDGEPVIEEGVVRTRRERGNVTIVQLIKTGQPVLVVGRDDPIQGWFSRHADDRIPAPVVEVPQRGRLVRYLTLLIPSAEPGAPYEVRDLEVRPGGYSATITVGGLSERVTVDGERASIEPLP